MTRNLLRYLFLAAVLLPYFVFAQNAHYENRIIETLTVVFEKEGEESTYEPTQVLSKVKTKEGGVFSQTDFDNDLKILAQEYDHVEPEIELMDANLRITLKVWPKPVIRSIVYEGNCKISRSDLQSELGICAGTLFDRHEFNCAFKKLKAYYVKKGFFEAELDFDVAVDPCSNCVDVTITVDEGRSGRIKEIIFCGFDKCEEEELAEMMVTKTYSFFMSWITGEGTYNEDAIQIDEYRILSYLQNEGYADAQVDIEVTEANECDRIIIYIYATKGEQYYIGPISFEGNCILSDEDIEECIDICEGDIYSPEDIRETIGAIQDAYGRLGYIDAVVDFEARLIEGENAYELKFYIEEGDQFRIGLIRVLGNTCTQTRVILHECLLIPGQVFNIDALKATEARLLNIGYFKCVNVYPAQPNDLLGEGCNYRDVMIEVEETGTGNFSAFFGFSTTESLFGGFSITERNFNHNGLCSFWHKGLRMLRGGGEFLSFTANIGIKSHSYVLSWTEPHFRDTPWSVGFDLSRAYNHYTAEDYIIKTTGLAVHATYPLTPFLRFGCHYRITNANVTVTKDATTLMQEEARTGGLISATGIHLALDNTDSPVCPTRGLRSKLEGEYAGIGGDHHFWSFGYINAYYYSLCEDGVIKLRGDMRYISPIGGTIPGTIPLDERLFLGGDNDVRGYRPYAIGPKYPGTTDPRGGMSLQLLSAEYNHRLFSRMDIFVFFDSGALSFEPWHIAKLQNAAGFGARIKLMEASPPVTLGIGFPINPRSRSDVRRFFWSMGGRF